MLKRIHLVSERKGVVPISMHSSKDVSPLQSESLRKIDAALVRQLADLSHLTIEEDEIPEMISDLEEMANLVAPLESFVVDTPDTESRSSTTFPEGCKRALRSDVVHQFADIDAIVRNMPTSQGNKLCVPPVMASIDEQPLSQEELQTLKFSCNSPAKKTQKNHTVAINKT
eukprot:GHVT01068480.1.p1 GENE.GHVT01068480.1~~GHVT01068480.1.p1  ORF type:complete len:171 (-),score=12.89 GHVT01068480.1:811-1323(-)